MSPRGVLYLLVPCILARSTQLAPVLVKSARSGSTWLSSILQNVTMQPFSLEVGGPPLTSKTLHLLLNGNGYSMQTDPWSSEQMKQKLDHVKLSWSHNAKALAGRIAVIVLTRRNTVKHAIAAMRFRLYQFCKAIGTDVEKGRLAIANDTDVEKEILACNTQPRSLNLSALKTSIWCEFELDRELSDIANVIANATGAPLLALDYEEMQVQFTQVLQRIRAHLGIHAPVSGVHNRALHPVKSGDLVLAGEHKKTSNDVGALISNREEVLEWVASQSSCLAQQFLEINPTFPQLPCPNPWANESFKLTGNNKCGTLTNWKRFWSDDT